MSDVLVVVQTGNSDPAAGNQPRETLVLRLSRCMLFRKLLSGLQSLSASLQWQELVSMRCYHGRAALCAAYKSSI